MYALRDDAGGGPNLETEEVPTEAEFFDWWYGTDTWREDHLDRPLDYWFNEDHGPGEYRAMKDAIERVLAGLWQLEPGDRDSDQYLGLYSYRLLDK